MYQAVEILVPLGAFAMIFGIVYLGVTSKHREKMAMIEAGMNPEDSKNNKQSKIRAGLLLLFVPLGILTGNLLSSQIEMLKNDELGLIFAFLFGGIALIVSYFLEKRFNNETDDNY
jgi:NADH:ubiquinone oxidoreductase subunit 3 (subunit A)